jgi:hypothetical protein
MVEQTIYEVLDTLAEKHIPEGRHKILHVNSREAWVDLMSELIDSGAIRRKLSILTKCAISWELLLVQKISIQN